MAIYNSDDKAQYFEKLCSSCPHDEAERIGLVCAEIAQLARDSELFCTVKKNVESGVLLTLPTDHESR